MAHYCFVAAQYLPTPGGVERYTNQLGRELVGRGHSVTVLTSALPGLPGHEVTDGIEIFRVKGFPLLKGRFPVAFKGKGLRKLFDKVLSRPETKLVIQTRFYPLSVWALQYAAARKVPYIVIEHGSAHLQMGNKFINIFSEWYEHGAMLLFRRKKARFYAVSKAGVVWLQHFSVQAQGVLYNALNWEEIHRLASQGGPALAALALPQERPLLVFSGRLVAEKGIVQLLQAVEVINQGGPKVQLVVAGEGPLRGELQEKYNGQAVFTGNLPQPVLFALLQKAQLFCLPSDSEGMPTSVLEAAALECYVITTRQGGAKELITGPELGCILESNSKQEVQTALEEALNHLEECRGAAVMVSRQVEEKFTFKATCDTLEQIYF